jgi:hypothetical protein
MKIFKIYLIILFLYINSYGDSDNNLKQNSHQLTINDKINETIRQDDLNSTENINEIGILIYGNIISNDNGFGLAVESGNTDIRKSFYKTKFKNTNESYIGYYTDTYNSYKNENSYVFIGPSVRLSNILKQKVVINLAILKGVSEDENIKNLIAAKLNFKYKFKNRFYLVIDGYLLSITNQNTLLQTDSATKEENELKYKTTVKTTYTF